MGMMKIHRIRRRDGVKQAYWEKVQVEKKGRMVARRSPGLVLKTAEHVKRTLAPIVDRIEIVGSIRRKVANPTDIDIILIPNDFKIDQLKPLISKLGTVTKSGDKYVSIIINGIQCDIYLATEQDWGAQLMTRTGPWTSNLGNRTLAKNKGMLLNQYGLWHNGKKIAGETEQGIFEALGKPYKPPEQRGLSR